MNQKIQCLISHNEKKSNRATGLAKAIAEDTRFELPEYQDINVDLQFSIKNPTWIEVNGELVDLPRICFNVEMKECPDYISSTLGPDGHIALQYLDMAEAGHRCLFLVLGSDWEVSRAIYDSLRGAGCQGSELAFKVSDYENRLRDFEAQCFGLYAPVVRWAIDKRKLDDESLRWPGPYKRLLSHVHKTLTGPSMAGYYPRPQENERELVSANCLIRGIGDKTWANVLREYRIALVPRAEYAKPIEEIKGVGPKRAEDLNKIVVMYYDGRGEMK